VDGIKKHSEEIMEKTKKVLDEVAAIPVGHHTFENTIKRIADQEAEHSIASAICTFPSYPIKK
jgi:O6-methylguanine-DNA--protein-cysteine methyltransferase